MVGGTNGEAMKRVPKMAKETLKGNLWQLATSTQSHKEIGGKWRRPTKLVVQQRGYKRLMACSRRPELIRNPFQKN